MNNEVKATVEKDNTEPVRVKGFFITMNPAAITDKMNYDTLEAYVLKAFKRTPEYFCFVEERGEKGEKNHIHLYVEAFSQHTEMSIRKKFEKANVQPRRGTPTQVRDYIFKLDTAVRPAKEFGDFTRLAKIQPPKADKENVEQGKAAVEVSTDTKPKKYISNETVEYMLDNFDTLAEMAEYNAWIYNQMRRTIEQLFYERKIKRFKESHCTATTAENGDVIHEVNRKVYYLWGATASGKTKGIMRKFGKDVSILTQLQSKMKYDDYDNTGAMVLDEFYGQLTIQEMLNLLDGYVTELPCRYSNKSNVAHTIIMTSNVPFSDQYNEAKMTQYPKYKAFERRINAGEWEMYQTRTGDRYIACHTDLTKIEERLQGLYDLSEPPISLKGSKDGKFKPVKLISPADMGIVKHLDSENIKITKKAIAKHKQHLKKKAEKAEKDRATREANAKIIAETKKKLSRETRIAEQKAAQEAEDNGELPF